MDTWPNEIAFILFEKCDFLTLLNLRQTGKLNKLRVETILSKRTRFDSRWYTNHMRAHRLRIPKMIEFLVYFPSVKKLIIADFPCLISMVDMIRITKMVPFITDLTLVQTDRKFIGEDALLTLIYLKKLINLKLVGWEPSHIVRKGNASRYESIPSNVLKKLHSLEIVCNRDTVSKVLENVVNGPILMPNIRNVTFEVRHSTYETPILAIRFIQAHPHLKSISLNGFLFTTSGQVEALYEQLLKLPKLKTISFQNCSVVDRLERSLQKSFIDKLQKRGITHSNYVQSLRYL